MSDETFNLLRLLVQLLGTIAGIGLFIAAVWRDEWKARFVTPKLVLYPTDFPKGESTMLGTPRRHPAIYWHARVTNKKQWIIAKNVELQLQSISLGPPGKLIPYSGSGTFRLQMKDADIKDSSSSIADVGFKDLHFDLFRLTDQNGLEVRVPGRIPNNLGISLTEAGTMEMRIQARGDNAVSNSILIRIDWNGDSPSQFVPGDSVRIECKGIYEGFFS